MEHVLMNFGDNLRVVNASDGSSIPINIGEIVRADVHEVHAKMIQRGLATETLIICDMEFAQKATRKLGQVMEVMRDLNAEDYDGLLERFHKIAGPNPEELRPTREMLRIALREIARDEIRQMIDAQRVRIHEQGDEVTRQPVLPPPSPPKDDKPKDKKASAAGEAKEKGQEKPKSKIKRERL